MTSEIPHTLSLSQVGNQRHNYISCL